MSKKHPVIAVTGSSGAGTTTVKRTFEQIFRRESIEAAVLEGDSFHSLTRAEFKDAVEEADKNNQRAPSHFGPEANHFDKIEETFRQYGDTGMCKRRYYVHSVTEATEFNARLGSKLQPGEFTPWEDIPAGSDILFYEGLHGGVVTDKVNIAKYVDLLIGVVPIVNLEWIQKIHRDTAERGYSAEAVTQTILRRMRDYVEYICPQFSNTDINFQRVSTVDTSNPFVARDIPTLDESFVVIRYRDPAKADFEYLLSMLKDSFMSRRNTIVVPGGKMGLAMELILSPLIKEMVARRYD
ncbi:MAG TPA: phosphoribulokinase [Methylophilaceae bacterium]|jgi:phosphoribulokinase|nr:phosphoribulokinase [Methylophilaceae bacterium]